MVEKASGRSFFDQPDGELQLDTRLWWLVGLLMCSCFFVAPWNETYSSPDTTRKTIVP